MRSLVILCALSATALAQAPFDKSGIQDWKTPPKPSAEPTFKPPVAKRSKLKNGMALLLVENHALPIVSMRFVIPGAGAASDPDAKPGLASFTADLLDEGAGDLSAIAISEETDRLGASVFSGVDVDATYVGVSTLTKTLDPTLDLVAKILTQPTFDAKEFDRVKGDRMTALELRRDRPREVAQQVLEAALYGRSTAYGHPVSGARETFKDIAIADAQAFYKEHYNPSFATLVVVGDFDPKALRAKLDAGIGTWKQPGAKKPAKLSVKAAKIDKRLLLVDRKDAAQSDVRVGIVGVERGDRRYFAFEVLSSALGGGFTSRLVQKLREDMGITYGAHAGEDFRLGAGPFMIATAIVTPSTGQGLGEIMKMVDSLATTDIPKEELEKTKEHLIRALPEMFGTNSATASAIADLALFGLPDNWYASYSASIHKITASDVKAAAKTIIPSKGLAISIVGDYSKIKGEVEKLGFGDPAMFDLYGLPVAK